MPSAINRGIAEKYAGQEGAVASALDESENRIWAWFERNKDEVLIEKRVLFWTIRLTVGDLAGVLRAILSNSSPSRISA